MSAQIGLKKVNKAAADAIPQTTGLVYRSEKGTGKSVVGYFLNGIFVVLSRHGSNAEARARINYLNGGSGQAQAGGAVAA